MNHAYFDDHGADHLQDIEVQYAIENSHNVFISNDAFQLRNSIAHAYEAAPLESVPCPPMDALSPAFLEHQT